MHTVVNPIFALLIVEPKQTDIGRASSNAVSCTSSPTAGV